MTLDKKLTRLRKKEGMSQAEVSERLDVSRQAVSRWEAGDSKPSTENLQALSKLYNVQLDYLLDEGEDEPPAPAPADPETPAAESGPEREAQKKGKQRIKCLVIGAVVLILLVCGLVWYGNRQKESGVDLHSVQGENSTFSEASDFDLNFE